MKCVTVISSGKGVTVNSKLKHHVYKKIQNRTGVGLYSLHTISISQLHQFCLREPLFFFFVCNWREPLLSRSFLAMSIPQAKMELRPLGNTGLKVSSIGFGASPLGSVFGPVAEVDAVATVREAFRQGINFFDTSP